MLHGTEAGSASDGGDRCQLDELCISLSEASALVPMNQVHKLKKSFQLLLTFLALWFLGVYPTNCWGQSPVCGQVPKFKCIFFFFFLTLGQNLEDAVNIILNLCKYMKEKTFVWNFLGLCKVCLKYACILPCNRQLMTCSCLGHSSMSSDILGIPKNSRTLNSCYFLKM